MFFYKKVSKDLWKFLEVGFSLLYIGIFLGCIALFIKGDNYTIHLSTTIKYITYSFYVDRVPLCIDKYSTHSETFTYTYLT